MKKNNNFKLLCIGVVAFSAVATIVFVSLGGGKGVAEPTIQEGFNPVLPTADVETVSDDRILAARKEDERRKREEMQGISGSTFQLLEIEETKKEEKRKADSLFSNDAMVSEAKNNIDKKIYNSDANAKTQSLNDELKESGFNVEESKKRVETMNSKIEYNRKERYKQMQQIYGEELLPDNDTKTEKICAEKTENSNNSEIIQNTKKRNKGFNTLNAENYSNTSDVKAVVHGTHKDLTDNSMVKLRLIDAITINDIKIPRNSFVYGKVSFSNARVQISVDNINYQNKVLPFNGQIYDHDGSKGIHVPDNSINDASREGGSNAINGSTAVIPGTGIAGQIAAKMANNAVGTVKNAVVKKINKNKVTISDNYLVTIKIK